jgi:hypothetical protein
MELVCLRLVTSIPTLLLEGLLPQIDEVAMPSKEDAAEVDIQGVIDVRPVHAVRLRTPYIQLDRLTQRNRPYDGGHRGTDPGGELEVCSAYSEEHQCNQVSQIPTACPLRN